MKLVMFSMRKISARHSIEFFWVGFGQGISFIASLLTIKFLTNIVTPDIYGYYNLMMVAMVLPNWLLFSPLSQPLQRYFSAYRSEGKLNELVWTTFIPYVWISLLTLLIFNSGVWFGLFKFSGIDALSLHIASIIFVFEAWISLGTSFSSASRERFRVSMTMTSVAVFRPLFLILSTSLLGNILPAVMIGYLVSSIAVAWYALRPLADIMLISKQSKFNFALLRKMLQYGLPFGIWSFFAWMQQYVDRYIVESIVGADSLGSYVAALQASSLPFSIAGGLLAQFITPIVYQKVGNGDDHIRLSEASNFLMKISTVMGGVGSIVVCLYAFFGTQFMHVLTSKSFSAPSSLMALLSLSMLVTTIAQQLTLVLLAYNRAGQLLIVKVLPGLISVPVLWVLVKKFSLFGAAFGTLIVSIVYISLIVLTVQRLNRNNHLKSIAPLPECL